MISVIVPVYNAEPYLRRCLSSILDSSYQEFELILINDGSTDKSPEICREQAAKDSRIRLISQENRGVSAARNRGLDICRGEWVVFVDADDPISPNFLGMIAQENLQSQDLLLFDFAQTEAELVATHPVPKVLQFGPEDVVELLRALLVRRQLINGGNLNLVSPCGKAYKRTIIQQYNIRFNPTLSLGEDKLFNVEYLLKTQHCTYLSAPVYYYNTYQSSSSHRFDPDRFHKLGDMLSEIEGVLKAGGFFPLLEDDFLSPAQDNLSFFLWIIFSPYHKTSRLTKYQRCKDLRDMAIFEQISIYHPKVKMSIRSWPRRVLFFLFRTRQYSIINFLSQLNRILNPTPFEKIEEMRNNGWLP